jgi:hypothetical protein
MNRFQTRVGRLVSVWCVAAVAEATLYYFFLSRPYFRTFFLPFAMGVLCAAGLETWRVVRGRRGVERRESERRVARRRAEE